MSSARPLVDQEMPPEMQAQIQQVLEGIREKQERRAQEQKTIAHIKNKTKAIQQHDAQSLAATLKRAHPNARTFKYGLQNKEGSTHVFVFSPESPKAKASAHSTNETEVAAKLLVDVGILTGRAISAAARAEGELSLYKAMFQGTLFQPAADAQTTPPNSPAPQQGAAAAPAAPQAPLALRIHIPASEETSTHEPAPKSPTAKK